jgi:hypothetical protein
MLPAVNARTPKPPVEDLMVAVLCESELIAGRHESLRWVAAETREGSRALRAQAAVARRRAAALRQARVTGAGTEE